MRGQPPTITPDKVIFLHLTPYGERDLIISLLGERCGRINAFAKGGRSHNKRFGSGIEPGALAQVELTPPGPESDLWRLKGWHSLEHWPWMAPEEKRLPVKICGAYLLDNLHVFSQYGAFDPDLFQLANLAMAHLATTPNLLEFCNRFQFRLLCQNGICPDFTGCDHCHQKLSGPCFPYGATIIGPCCRSLLPIAPESECAEKSRLGLVALQNGGKVPTGFLDLAALRLTRALLAFHFQKTLKSAGIFETVMRGNV